MRDALEDPLGTVFDDEVGTAVRSYADALLNASAKTGEADAVVGELEEVVDDLLRPNPRFALMLASPSVPAHEKDRILSELLDGRAMPTVVRFLKVLNHHGRLGMLAPVAREARARWDERQDRRPVLVKTAVALDDGQREALSGKVAAMIGATPILRYEVDPALIGGLVVQVGDDLYDASIKTKLQNMRRDLLAGRAPGLSNLID